MSEDNDLLYGLVLHERGLEGVCLTEEVHRDVRVRADRVEQELYALFAATFPNAVGRDSTSEAKV